MAEKSRYQRADSVADELHHEDDANFRAAEVKLYSELGAEAIFRRSYMTQQSCRANLYKVRLQRRLVEAHDDPT